MAFPSTGYNPNTVTYNVNWSNGVISFSFSVDQNGNAPISEAAMVDVTYAIADAIHSNYPNDQVTIDRSIAGSNVSSLGYPRP